MNKRDNLLSLLRRKGYQEIPVEFSLCPALFEEYRLQTQSHLPYGEYFQFPSRSISDLVLPYKDPDVFAKYHDDLKPETYIDGWGVAHEKGSEQAMHMTRMIHPLKKIRDIEDLLAYPFPEYITEDNEHQKNEVKALHAQGLAAVGNMPCTIWETAWYMRSMDELMMDMMSDDVKAEFLLDKVTEIAVKRAASYADAGVDILFLGDDIGMQQTIMMSVDMYRTWLQPRLKKVIDAARAKKPDIIVFYHSCGFVVPFIPYLIDAGIDVLNPVQPECMAFKEIYEAYGDRLSFHGTLGTQTTMPFGTPEEVRAEVFKNLSLAGDKGGLFVVPSHLLEPEVPWRNILAYVNACRDFTR